MADLLFDTDVFVDHLRGAARLETRGHRISFSVITRAELFAGRETDEGRVQELLAPLRELPLDRAVAERAGRLRRHTAISMPDALIAASALENDLDLVTRNRRDFDRVPHLRVIDPSALAHRDSATRGRPQS